MIEIQEVNEDSYSCLATVSDGFVPDPKSSVAIIALKGNEIIGRIFLLAPAHIEGPWVSPEYRGAFVVKRLMEHAEQTARERGITKLMAYAASATLENYLERLGFRKMPLTVWGKDI